jgi:hypothetical protein
MSTIKRTDIIDDEALQAPLILAKHFLEAVEAAKKVAESGMKISQSLAGPAATQGTQKLKQVTEQLTAEQKELKKVGDQIATVTAKNNAQYQAQEKRLKEVRKAIKDKNDIGERDAKTITKQTASLKELEAALRINREAFANLRTEEERASESGQELLKVIQQQAASVAETREEMAQFGHNVGNYTGSILKAQQEIKRLEKETLALARAQDKQETETEQGKKAFNQYNTQIKANITQINIYRDAVHKASMEQKKLDSGGKGGGFGGAVEGLGDLSPALGEGVGKVQQLQGAFKKLLASPVGPYLAAIGAGVAAIGAYFTGSIEGQDRFGRKMTWLTSYTNVFRQEVEKLGKYLVDMWDNPIQGIKDYVELGLNNIFNRVKAIGVLWQGVAAAFTGNFKKAAKLTADAVLQFYSGITNATDKLAKFQAKVSKEQAIRDEIEIRNQAFKKAAIQDIIDDSITELEVSKLLAKVKDDLRFADEDRLTSLRKANDLLEEQVKGDIELAKQELSIAEDLAALDAPTYEEAQKLAELRAKVNKTEEAYFQTQKKRLLEEFSLVREIQNKRLAFIKAQQDAYDNLETWRLENIVSNNEKILAEENSTMAERFRAIVTMSAAQVTLAEEAADKEKEAALEAAKARVNLSSQERQEIYMNKKLSIDEQLALEAEYITARAEIDQAFVTETLRIEEERAAKIKEINDGIADMRIESALAVLARDNEKWADQVGEDAADAMKALNVAYSQGLVNTAEYLRQRTELEDQANRDSVSTQLGYVNEQLQIVEDGSVAQYDLLKEQAELELELAEETAAKKLEYEQQLQEAMTELRTEAAESAMTVISNLFDGEDMKRQERLDKIAEKEAIETQMAGDNEVAKAAIKNKYALEAEKLRKQQAAADRKRAIFEKATAAIQIAINTATAISKAVAALPLTGGLPFSAIAAAIGAVQLAAVLSKPIPSYAVGTENHPGGLARVGEKGTEKITLPDGSEFYTPPSETIMALPARTKVDTHQETVRQLAMEGLRPNDSTMPRRDNKELKEMHAELQAMHHTFKNKKIVQINYTRRGAEAVILKAANRVKMMDDFYGGI